MKIRKKIRAVVGVVAATALTITGVIVGGGIASATLPPNAYESGRMWALSENAASDEYFNKAVKIEHVGTENADGVQQWKVTWQSGSTQPRYADNDYQGYGFTPYLSIILSPNMKFASKITYQSKAAYQYMTSCPLGTWKGTSDEVSLAYNDTKGSYVSPTNSAHDAIWSGCSTFGNAAPSEVSGSGYKLRGGDSVSADDSGRHDFDKLGISENYHGVTGTLAASDIKAGGQYISFQAGASGGSVSSQGRATTYTATFSTQRDTSGTTLNGNKPNNWVAAQYKDYYNGQPYRSYVAYQAITNAEIVPNPAQNPQNASSASIIDPASATRPAASSSSTITADNVVDYKVTLNGTGEGNTTVGVTGAANKLRIANTTTGDGAAGLIWLQKNSDGLFSRVDAPVFSAEGATSNVYHTYVTSTTTGNVNFQVTYTDEKGTAHSIAASDTADGYLKQVSANFTQPISDTETNNYVVNWQGDYRNNSKTNPTQPGTVLRGITDTAAATTNDSTPNIGFTLRDKTNTVSAPKDTTVYITYPGVENSADAQTYTLADGTTQKRVPVVTDNRALAPNRAAGYVNIPEITVPQWDKLTETDDPNLRTFDVVVYEKSTDNLPIRQGKKTIYVSKPAAPATVSPEQVKSWSGNAESYPAGTEVPAGTIKATVADADGNVATAGTKVKVTIAGATEQIAQTVTVGDNGEVSIPAFTPKAGTDAKVKITISKEDGTALTAASNTSNPLEIPVQAGTPAKVSVWSGVPEDSVVAGTEVSGVKATVQDANGNLVASGTKVAVTVPGKTDPQIVEVGDNGEVTIPNFTPTKSGANTITIAAADAAGTGAGDALTNGTKTITVKPDTVDASKSTYEVKNGASGSVAGSGLGQVEIVLKDAYGNTITDDLSDSLVLPTFEGNQPQVVARQGKTITFSTTKYAYTVIYSSTKAGTFPYLAKVNTANGEQQPIVNLVTGSAEDDTPVTTAVNPDDNTTWGALKWVSAAPAKVSVWSGVPEDSVVAGTVVSGVKATVQDANGNLVASGTKVAVTVPGKTDPQIVEVGDNGEVTIPNFTPTKSGANTVTIAAADAAGAGAGDVLTNGTKTITVTPNEVDASKSTASLTTDYASYGVSDENTTGTPNVVRIQLKDKYGNPTALGNGQTVTVTSSHTSEDFTVTIGAANAVDGQLGVYTVDIKGQVQGSRPTGTADETIRTTDLQAKLGSDSIGDPLKATFVSPPVNTDISQTNFSITKTDTNENNVLADGVDTYTVTVSLYAEDTQNNHWELQPLTGRAKTLQVTDATGTIKVVKAFKDNGDGTYTAEIASTQAHEGAIQVTTSGEAVNPADGQTAGSAAKSVKAVFTEATVDASQSTFTVNPAEATAGDDVTLVYTPKDAHGNPITVPEGVQVTGRGSDSITLTKQKDGTYTATVPVETAGKYTLTPVATGTTEPAIGPTAALTVKPSTFTAAKSDLTFKPVAPATVDNFVAGNKTKLILTPKDAQGNPTKSKISVNSKQQDTVTVGVDGKDHTLTWDATSGTYVSDEIQLTKAGKTTATVTAVNGVPSAKLTVKAAAPNTVDWDEPTWNEAAQQTNETPLTGTAGGTLAGAAGVVKDTHGNPVPQAEVTVKLPDGSAQALTADGNGKITISDVALPATAGDSQIVVSTGETTLSTVKVTTSAGAVNVDSSKGQASTSAIDTGTKKADGTDHYTVTVKLVDANGNPVSGKKSDLVLKSDDDAAKIPGLADIKFTPKDGEPGTYVAEVPSKVALKGTVQVTYKNGETTLNVGSPLNVEFVAGAVNVDPTKAKDPSDDSANVNNASWDEITSGNRKADNADTHTLTVHLRDVYGNPVTLDNDGMAKLGLRVEQTSTTARSRAARAAVDGADTLNMGEWKAVDGTAGAYAIDLTSTAARTYHLIASYNNEDIHTGTVSDNAVVVDKNDTVLDATYVAAAPATATIANTDAVEQGATITEKPVVTVVDSENNPTAGADVWVKVGDKDPVKVTLADNGTVTLDGQNGAPDVDKLTANTTITVYDADPSAEGSTAKQLGTATINVKTPAPTDVVAVKDPSNDNKVTVSGKVPNAPANTTVTITDSEGNELGTATVDENGNFSTDIATDTTPVKVQTSAANQIPSEAVEANVSTRQSKPTSVTAVKDADGSKTTVTVGLPAEDAQVGDKVEVRDPSDPSKVLGTHTITDEDKAKGSVAVEITGDVPSKIEAVIADKDGDSNVTSQPVQATVDTKTATPVVSEANRASNGTVTVEGTVPGAVAGTTVEVRNANGDVIATGTTDAQGHFTATSVPNAPTTNLNDPVTVTATANGKVQSDPAAETTLTAKPNDAATGVSASKDPDTHKTTISGKVSEDVPVGTTVVITKPDGSTVTTEVKDNHTFSTDVDGLNKNDSVQVVVGNDDYKSPSASATVSEPDPFNTPTDVVAKQDDDAVTTVTGKSDAPDNTVVTVTVKGADGQDHTFTGTVQNGAFSVTVPADQKPADDKVTVTVGTGDRTSQPAGPINVTKPAQNTPASDVSAVKDPATGATTVSGKSDAADGTKVTVKDKGGNTIAEGKVEDGKIVDNDGKPITVDNLNDGDKVSVVIGKGQAASEPAETTVESKKNAASDVSAVKDPATGATTVSGKSDAADGTKVTVKDKDGNTIAEGKVEDGKIVDNDGKPITVDNLNDGDNVSVVIGEGDTTSDATDATVVTKNSVPSDVKAEKNTDGKTVVSGKSDAADGTKVVITDPKTGDVIRTGTVQDGAFTVVVDKAGDQVTVVVGEGAKASDPVTVDVTTKPTDTSNSGSNSGSGNTSDGNTKPAAPTDITVTRNGDGVDIKGKAPVGAEVVVVDPSGQQHVVKVDGSGHFSVHVSGVKPGDKLTVQTLVNGALSDPVVVTVPAKNIAEMLSETGTDVYMLFGTALALVAGAALALVARRRKQE